MGRDFTDRPLMQIGPEPADPRDYRIPAAPIPRALPSSFQLPKVFPVRDQGRINACTGYAVGTLLAMAEYRKKGKAPLLSPLFLYFISRVIDGWPEQDIGTWLRSALKAATKWGVSPEMAYPYEQNEARYAEQPPFVAKLLACFRKRYTYVKVEGATPDQTMQNMKTAIADGSGVALAIVVFNGLYYAPNGDIPLPYDGERSLGGHAIYLYGYDDAAQMFLVMNSWGIQWGSRGYGRLPYEYVRRGWTYDGWTCFVGS